VLEGGYSTFIDKAPTAKGNEQFPDRWYQPASIPRNVFARTTPFGVYPSSLFVDMGNITVDMWYLQASEPVRKAPQPTMVGIYIAFIDKAPAAKGGEQYPDRWWQPTSQPIFRRPVPIIDTSSNPQLCQGVSIPVPSTSPGGELDPYQIIQDIYDPTQKALRTKIGLTNFASGTLDPWQIFITIHDIDNHCLRIVQPVAGSGNYGTNLDWQQIVQQSFNTTLSKLVVVDMASSGGQGTGLSFQQIFKVVFDTTKLAIRGSNAGAASGSNGTKMNWNQIWQQVYDPVNGAIRFVSV